MKKETGTSIAEEIQIGIGEVINIDLSIPSTEQMKDDKFWDMVKIMSS